MIGVAARLLLSFRSWKREIRRFDVSNKKERRGAKREGKLQKNETPACLRCPFPFPLSLSLSLFFSSKPLSLSVPLPLPSLLYNLSHRVLARPLAGRLLVPRPVRLVDVRDLRHQGVIGVRVAQQRADREQHFRQRQGGRPLLLEDVEANGALGVDVGVVDLFWWGFLFCFGIRRGDEQEEETRGRTTTNEERTTKNEKTLPLLPLSLPWSGTGLSGA